MAFLPEGLEASPRPRKRGEAGAARTPLRIQKTMPRFDP